MRVLEVVGAGPGNSEKEEKRYSPRTESHVKQLIEVLDFFEYSRSDIAALVRKCHHDEHQIQIAVANIIEDRANHEQTDWGVVRTKKQLKEDKKLKEEEEKEEQVKLAKEMEKQRKDAEKRAQREYNRENLGGKGGGQKHGGRDGGHGGYDAPDVGDAVAATGVPATLPPDPAIIFAGLKPTPGREPERSNDEWWDGAAWEWDNKDGGGAAKTKEKSWENGKDWEWQHGQWDEGDWTADGGGGGKSDDAWWSGDWDKAGGGGGNETSVLPPPTGKRGPKEPRGAAAKKELAEMWDMPDTTGPVEGGLDQWVLGDIRAHERRVAGGEAAEPIAKALPESAVRTVEEIEREQGAKPGAGGATRGRA